MLRVVNELAIDCDQQKDKSRVSRSKTQLAADDTCDWNKSNPKQQRQQSYPALIGGAQVKPQFESRIKKGGCDLSLATADKRCAQVELAARRLNTSSPSNPYLEIAMSRSINATSVISPADTIQLRRIDWANMAY
jgi:hypothetical protein